MKSRIPTHRTAAFTKQGGRCFYCGNPMWLDNPEWFANAMQISARQLPWFQCTAEHLIARQDGGTDAATNIVAAHRYCNARRHAGGHGRPVEAYRDRVQRRVAQGKWLPNGLAKRTGRKSGRST